MKNFVQEGNVLTLTAPAGGVVSGGAYVVGAIAVVAVADAAAGEAFEGHRCGVFKLPATGTVTEGAKAYITSGGDATGAASGNTLVGAFASAKDANNEADVLFTGQVA